MYVVLFALSIADVKKGGFHLKKQSWSWKSHEGQLQGQNEGHHWIPRWNLLREWPSLFWKIFYLRKYPTVPGLFRHTLKSWYWLCSPGFYEENDFFIQKIITRKQKILATRNSVELILNVFFWCEKSLREKKIHFLRYWIFKKIAIFVYC